MDILTEDFRERIEHEEQYKIFMEFQKKFEHANIIPKTPRLFIRKSKKIFEFWGEIFFGMLIGEFTLIIVFLIFMRLLHIKF